MFAAVFPGQGSQHVGMGKFLHSEFAIARETFEEASEAIKFKLAPLCFDGADSDINLTENTQPALLTVSTATYRVLKQIAPFNPVASAGHSVGEYAAVVNSGALLFTDAVRAVRRRGELMQSAVPVGVGGMAATLGLEADQVKAICAWVKKANPNWVLEPANFNAPGQIVISGHQEALDWLQANFKPDAFSGAPARLKMIPLKVSAPFHCSLMTPAETGMAKFLESVTFLNSDYPVVQNVTAQPQTNSATLKADLIRQISAPVRWVECVKRLEKFGASRLIEVGCGKVLNGLAKKISPDTLTTLNINSLGELKAAEAALLV